MKNISLLIFSLFSIAFLAFGYGYYQERVAVSATAGAKNNAELVTEDSEAEGTAAEVTEVKYSELVSNWPVDAQENFLNSTEAGKLYKIAIVGSQAIGADSNGWSEQLRTSLVEAYGEDIVVELFDYDTTSIEFINSPQVQEVLEYAPDLVLYEPFSLNDNSGAVAASDNHDSIEILMANLQAANQNTILILQPTHPIYGATFYPVQVEELRAFAQDMGVTYLDHWQAWPNLDDESLEDYLTLSNDEPNEKGHKIWADYLIKYFIAE